MSTIQNKKEIVALVTGASSGIGSAICKTLLSNKCRLIICGRDAEKMKTLLSELKRDFPNSMIHSSVFNLASKEETTAFLNEIIKSHPQLDILINNAALFSADKILDLGVDKFQELMNVNVLAPMYLVNGFLPLLKKSDKAHVFNMCSIAALNPYPNAPAYGVTKFALNGWHSNLKEELDPLNIRSSIVFPGPVLTSSWPLKDREGVDFIMPEEVAESIWDAYEENEPKLYNEIYLTNFKS